MILHLSKTREVASIPHAGWIVDGAEEPPHLIEIDSVYPQPRQLIFLLCHPLRLPSSLAGPCTVASFHKWREGQMSEPDALAVNTGRPSLRIL
eukprot:scaffold4605_cov150-Skeletonema_dohrnii-CCMP3373.AAC.3